MVTDLNSIRDVLLPIFDKYPLLTTKTLEISDFKKAIEIKLNSPTPKLSTTDIAQISDIKKGINLGRKEIFEKKHNIVQWHYNIDSYWLLGLVEGEGTFGFKNLSPYFQIGLRCAARQPCNILKAYLYWKLYLDTYKIYLKDLNLL